MVSKTLSNKEIFRIQDIKRNMVYYGCDQEWYSKKWQRISGCGPTTASNIIHYITNREISSCVNKDYCLDLMKEVWKYVTPTLKGVNTTKMFSESFLAYAGDNGIDAEARICDVPKEKALRPELPKIVRFIEEALSKDSPVAFLNLCNGKEENLDRWHWVTVVSIEYDEAEGQAFAGILDQGLVKKIDISLWHRTTTLGGGFVYFVASGPSKKSKV